MEGAKPSTSLSAQPGQDAHEASNSDNMAGTSKRKDKKRQQQQQPVTQLLEDQALNAELDAANTGGMVETERDRLIRVVSAQNCVHTILLQTTLAVSSCCCVSLICIMQAI